MIHQNCKMSVTNSSWALLFLAYHSKSLQLLLSHEQVYSFYRNMGLAQGLLLHSHPGTQIYLIKMKSTPILLELSVYNSIDKSLALGTLSFFYFLNLSIKCSSRGFLVHYILFHKKSLFNFVCCWWWYIFFRFK